MRDTDPVDEVVLDGVLFPLAGAVHAGRPLDGLLLDVPAAGGLEPLLGALRRRRDVHRLDGLDLKGAPFDVLVVQTQGQRQAALLGRRVRILVRAVLIVHDLASFRAVGRRHEVGGERGVARLAQIAVLVFGGDGDGGGHAHRALPQPLAGGHRLGRHGAGGGDAAQVMDGLAQAVRLRLEVQLVVLGGPQGQLLAGEPRQTLAHLLADEQHLGLAAVAQGLLREVAAAEDALLALHQRAQLGLEHLHADTQDTDTHTHA